MTDDGGLVFQHLEYFPAGETWVQEHNDIFRTPHLFAGGYFDEVRKVIDLGERWYEPREQFVYSPDPVLVEEPTEVIDDPALLPAYSYAESNPLSPVDDIGRQPSGVRTAFTTAFALLKGGKPAQMQFAARAAKLVADAAARSGARPGARLGGAPGPAASNRSSRLWLALERSAVSTGFQKLNAFTERFEAKPLVQINLVGTGKGWALQDVKVSPAFSFKQFTVFKGAGAKPPAPAAASSSGAAAPQPSGDAAGGSGALPRLRVARLRAAPPPPSGAP